MAEAETVIQAGRSSARYGRDLWDFRGLLYFLAQRDILVRYKQAAFGVTWAWLKPGLTILIFTFVFGHVAHLPSEGVPYPLFVLAATLPWQLFSGALGEGGNSLVANANLVSKVYFPRMLVPASAVLVGLADFLVSLCLLAGLMAWFGQPVTPRLLALPFFLALCLASSLGLALWLSALNARYRDFRHAIPFLVQAGFYASPVGYGSSVVPARYLALFRLNPMVGVIDGFRWSLFGAAGPDLSASLSASLAASFLLLASGWVYFRRTERVLADVI
jgi:lipopolysaccharide transport system permease protein